MGPETLYVNTFKTHLKAAVDRARDEMGLSVSAIARLIDLHHVTLRKALKGDDKAMGWDAVVKVIEGLKLSPEARQDMLWSWLETKAARSDESAAFLRAIRILAKDMKESEPRIRSLVLRLYEERLGGDSEQSD